MVGGGGNDSLSRTAARYAGLFTQQVAADVRGTGSRNALEPRNAADRKVVHDTVNGIDGVRTVSEGEYDPRLRLMTFAPLSAAQTMPAATPDHGPDPSLPSTLTL